MGYGLFCTRERAMEVTTVEMVANRKVNQHSTVGRRTTKHARHQPLLKHGYDAESVLTVGDLVVHWSSPNLCLHALNDALW